MMSRALATSILGIDAHQLFRDGLSRTELPH